MPGINNNSDLLPLQGCFAHTWNHLPISATKSLLGDYSDIILAVSCEWGGWMGLNPLCHTEITFVTRVPGRPIHRLVDSRLFRMWNGFGTAACLFSKSCACEDAEGAFLRAPRLGLVNRRALLSTWMCEDNDTLMFCCSWGDLLG